MERQTVVEELRRVAASLKSRFLSRSTFAKHGTISTAAVEATFGSWTEAIIAAGLHPLPPGGLPKSEQRRPERVGKYSQGSHIRDLSDNDLLDDLLRLARELGRRPSGNQVSAKGKFGRDVYEKRWSTVAHAYEVALRQRGS